MDNKSLTFRSPELGNNSAGKTKWHVRPSVGDLDLPSVGRFRLSPRLWGQRNRKLHGRRRGYQLVLMKQSSRGGGRGYGGRGRDVNIALECFSCGDRFVSPATLYSADLRRPCAGAQYPLFVHGLAQAPLLFLLSPLHSCPLPQPDE